MSRPASPALTVRYDGSTRTFAAGNDVVVGRDLRADVGEVGEAIAEWWQEFSTADDLRRQDLLEQVRDEQQRKTRQRVPQRALAEVDVGQEPAATVPPDGELAASAPRKRRRRRKPRGGAGGEARDAGGDTAGE